ncbi:hypothetical protein Ancab_030721 [Ancistrocladus abbreviatus]
MGELAVEKHVRYILSVEKKKDDFESVVMEHLRMNGAYWGLMTLDLLGKLDAVDQDEVISWIMLCQDESGGFSGNTEHDPHILYTLSAIQVLALFDKIHILDIDKVSNYIAGLQNEDGSFSGDIWGEVDTRCLHFVTAFQCYGCFVTFWTLESLHRPVNEACLFKQVFLYCNAFSSTITSVG